MTPETKNTERRTFIRQAGLLAFTLAASPVLATERVLITNDEKKPPLPPDLVREFVGASHANLPRVKELLAAQPELVNACWDWGGGDFETALNAASHTGNRDISRLLLDSGARKDIFSAVMHGETEVIAAYIRIDPNIVNAKGPHNLSVLYHAALSGSLAAATLIKPHLRKASADFNQALHSAVKHDDAAMTEWLLTNGVDNPSTKDIQGNTPLATAVKRSNNDIVTLLKRHGAV